MISNLMRPSIAFKANDLTSARDSYKAVMNQISKTVQKQNNAAIAPVAKNVQNSNNQISMQGAQGQKLDVIA